MVNKKAYIRTLEAVIAIVILLFATYTLTPKQVSNPRDTPYVVEAAQEYTITQVTQNSALRQMILDLEDPDNPGDPDAVKEKIATEVVEKRLPAGYTYEVEVCDNPSCISVPPEIETSVYMEDVLMAGRTTDGESVLRLVRVWFWREQ